MTDRTTHERLADLDRCRPSLRAAADQADGDPLLLLDLARALIGQGNRDACDGRCGASEWVDALIELTATLVGTVVAWAEADRRDVLLLLDAFLDRREFERDVAEDISDLPEVPG